MIPNASELAWAEGRVGPGARVLDVQAMHDVGGPWWLRIEHHGTVRNTMLRLGRPGSAQLTTVAAALQVAAEHAISAPRLLGVELEGTLLGRAVILETALPGDSTLPRSVTPARLREAGAAIAKVHAVRLEPGPGLPLRVRPTEPVDRAMERRWATAFRATAESEQDAIVAALCELTGWSEDRARRIALVPPMTPLLQLADDRIRDLGRPSGATVFVHGDVWGGNMRWEGDSCTALIDWRYAGAGDPGVDLGELRMQMAHQYGLEAADHVLDGWQREAGRQATDVAYWDAVAALNTPADMAGWPAFDEAGDPLDQPGIINRRDDFLRSALARL
ncbi:phosphotransferase family protein [Microlunatus speluncae]|uniref:phosphotransferase family protein n=1 Tax=Microlunatus speluncae TaxID=2594267 RepID=UPI0012667BF0|nr:aminoglycoside phosphotransferase family protein [Microlunatus speluncae]